MQMWCSSKTFEDFVDLYIQPFLNLVGQDYTQSNLENNMMKHFKFHYSGKDFCVNKNDW